MYLMNFDLSKKYVKKNIEIQFCFLAKKSYHKLLLLTQFIDI